MIQATLVQIADGDFRVRIYETREGHVIWARTVLPDDAVFLVMDIDDIMKELRQRMSRVVN